MQVFTQVLAALLAMGAAASLSAQDRTSSESSGGDGPHVLMQARPEPAKHSNLSDEDAKTSVSRAADSMAIAALSNAKVKAEKPKGQPPLPTEGKPGDVRLVVVKTDVIQRSRWIVPKVPVPPFMQWNKWLDEHPSVSHCALDYMDEQGKWWHTELRGFFQFSEEYRVGEGEFRATGTTIYGIFVVPGRSDPEDQEVLLDEKVNVDWKKVVKVAREYARKDKRPGDAGTGGKGDRNVGLGGPAWRPTCNSNTFISYILKECGVTRPEPPGAVGWDRTPTFPYSSDADVYGGR